MSKKKQLDGIKTSKKSLGEDLQKPLQLMQAIMASTNHLMISTDPEGIVTSFNLAAERQLGYKASNLVGKKTPSLWHDSAEVAVRAKELSEKYGIEVNPGFDVFTIVPQREGKETREWKFWHKDNSSFPGSLTVTCIRDELGHITGYLGVIEDITDRKKTESDILEARKFLKLVNDNNPDYVFVKDKDFKIVEANKAFISLYPKDKQDKIIGYTTVEEYAPKEAEYFLEKDREAFEKGYSRTLENIEFPNGTMCVIDTQKIRFENSKGEVYILGIARDITEKQKLIENLTDSNEKLEYFAYICSHDLQEPLRMISSFSDLLKSHMGDKLEKDEVGKKYFKFITDGASRAQNLLSDILEYSKIDKDIQKKEKVNINNLLKAITNDLEILLNKKSGKIVYQNMPEIFGNKTQLYQVFQNLINNAIKYSKEGEDAIVNVEAQEFNDSWQFSVKDNGIGVEKRFFDKIFDIFQRLHQKNEYNGTGIGLAICKKIVERHGGKIWIESEENVGSCFNFSWPKSKEEL